MARIVRDAGVRDLYAADLSARFEAAYLARPARRAEAPFRKGARFAPPPLAGASSALRQRRPATAGGAEELALLTGLLVHPALANQFAETIADLPLGDMRLAKLRSALFTALAASPGLDMAGLRHDLLDRGLGEVADSVRKSNRLAFSFTRPHVNPEIASRDFGMLADSIVARRRIDTELAAATARFRSSLDDFDFARQQAWLAERREIDQAMMRLAESLRDD